MTLQILQLLSVMTFETVKGEQKLQQLQATLQRGCVNIKSRYCLGIRAVPVIWNYSAFAMKLHSTNRSHPMQSGCRMLHSLWQHTMGQRFNLHVDTLNSTNNFLYHYFFSHQIWVHSPHNSCGYFTIYGDDPMQNDHFTARLTTGDVDTMYARTGYLGFIKRTDLTQADGGIRIISPSDPFLRINIIWLTLVVHQWMSRALLFVDLKVLFHAQ